ncbi:hypothetical protein V6Z11_A05G034800 [Gossypium hirsutum]
MRATWIMAQSLEHQLLLTVWTLSTILRQTKRGFISIRSVVYDRSRSFDRPTLDYAPLNQASYLLFNDNDTVGLCQGNAYPPVFLAVRRQINSVFFQGIRAFHMISYNNTLEGLV